MYSNTKVTLELRDVLASVDVNGQPFKLWDFDYPSYYQGDAKTAFEQKIIDHYLFHQIGTETVARFKHNFKTRIREIMPYYIQLYKSVEIMDKIEDPFGNVDVTETFEQSTTDTSSGTVNTTETGTASNTNTETGRSNGEESTIRTDAKTASENAVHCFSNTPQGSISNIDNYLTEASKDSRDQNEDVSVNGTVTTENETTVTNTGSGESSHTNTGTTETENSGTVRHTLTRKGNQGVNTYAHDMIEFRQSFINVDMMVIGALRDLFLLIY